MTEFIINGDATTHLDPLDRGFHYGDGLFETFAVQDGRPCLWQRHMARLQRGCDRLGIVAPDLETLHEEAISLCAGQHSAVLKLIVTRGPAGRGYAADRQARPTRWMGRFQWPEHTNSWRADGIRLLRCKTRCGVNSRLAGIKHLNRLEQVLAANELVESGADMGLMLDTAGHVIGASSGNLFIVRDDRLMTAPVDDCGIAGTVRGLIIEQANAMAQSVHVDTLTLDDVVQAEQLYVTNAIIGIVPVRHYGEQHFDVLQPWPEPLSDALREIYCP